MKECGKVRKKCGEVWESVGKCRVNALVVLGVDSVSTSAACNDRKCGLGCECYSGIGCVGLISFFASVVRGGVRDRNYLSLPHRVKQPWPL